MNWVLYMVSCTDKIGVLDMLESLFKVKQHFGPVGLAVRAGPDLIPPCAVPHPPTGTIIA
jgi:hypothetical protein